MAQQIRIGTPGKESPGKVFLEVFGLTVLTCAVLLAIALPPVSFVEVEPYEALPLDSPQRVQAAANQLREATLAQLEQGVASWDLSTQKAALQQGPRHAAEVLCEHLFVSPPEAMPELRSAMAASLRDGAEHAPRTCLLSRWFEGGFKQEPRDELVEQVEALWAEMLAFETPPAQNAFLVNSLKQQGRLPVKRPEFVRWLRRCATRAEDPAWLSCVSAMRLLAPHQGRDLLEMAEIHLLDRSERDTPLPADQLEELVELLERLATRGQPEVWRVEEHDALLNYDYDLRLGSLFALCRVVMTNERSVARAAGVAIARVAATQLTMSDRGLFRMRETCRIAFGGNKHDLEIASVPVLASNNVPQLKVLRHGLDDVPRYAFAYLNERGECPMQAGYPLWYCGAALWKGQRSEIVDDLKLAFINTRFVEWVPRDEVPDVDSDLVWKPLPVEPADQKTNP